MNQQFNCRLQLARKSAALPSLLHSSAFRLRIFLHKSGKHFPSSAPARWEDNMASTDTFRRPSSALSHKLRPQVSLRRQKSGLTSFKTTFPANLATVVHTAL